MKCEVRIHKGYAEWEIAKEEGRKFPLLFGKYHFSFYSDAGRISLIQLRDYPKKGINVWEIFCLEGNLFEDVERFDTKKEAEEKVRLYLE